MRIVVMVSGSGTNLQSILDAVAAGELPLDIAAVGADKPCLGIERAQAAGVPTFLVQPGDYADRPSWNRALEEKIPALLPSFPGAHGVRYALAHGVKITGLTVHFVDAGVDTGPILAQAAVPVLDDDTEETLHERIKVQERRLLVQTIASLAESHGAASDS
ncbi:MAG: phosphoribosylglycinamide formyltransferase [Rothia mucilaginosa]|nr:MAG: phosphoribosylglycinamide formyltransferase [Rothia mucilaginosa]